MGTLPELIKITTIAIHRVYSIRLLRSIQVLYFIQHGRLKITHYLTSSPRSWCFTVHLQYDHCECLRFSTKKQKEWEGEKWNQPERITQISRISWKMYSGNEGEQGSSTKHAIFHLHLQDVLSLEFCLTFCLANGSLLFHGCGAQASNF